MYKTIFNFNKRIILVVILIVSFTLGNTAMAATLSDGMNASFVIGAGSNTQDFTVSVPGATASTFNFMGETVFDETGNRLFVADAGNNRILVFNLNSGTKQLEDYTADNVLGQADFTSVSADRGGPAAANTLDGVRSLAYDPLNERLFAADLNNNRVLVYDLSGGVTNGMAASNVLGQADFTSTSANRGGTAAANTISQPEEVLYLPMFQALVVTDSSNHRILLYDVTTITNGEAAASVLGQADFTSSAANRGGSAGQNTLSSPAGLAFDTDTNYLYVGEGSTPTSNARIMIFDLTAISIGENAVHVLGQPDFTTTTGTTTQSGLNTVITGLYLDDNNRLFVADAFNNRVMVWDVSTISNGESAVNVLGQPDFTSNTNATTQSGFKAPTFFSYDTTNEYLYVSDGQNNRIMIFDIAETVTPGTVTYSGNFTESSPNDGSLDGSRIATIADDTFINSGSTLTLDTHYSLTNAPVGLTPVMTVNGDGSTATLTFTGNATNHESAHNVSDLTVTFLDGAFTNTATASDATGYTDASGTISFDDAPEEVTRRRSSSTPQSRAYAQKVFAEYYAEKNDTSTEDEDTQEESSEPSTNNNEGSTLDSGQCPTNLIVTQNLKQGSRDGQYHPYTNNTVNEVALVQQHINRILANYYDQAAGPVDGIFGPLTKQGVERLQATLRDEQGANLGPAGTDGIVGPMTRDAINGSCGEEEQ